MPKATQGRGQYVQIPVDLIIDTADLIEHMAEARVAHKYAKGEPITIELSDYERGITQRLYSLLDQTRNKED